MKRTIVASILGIAGSLAMVGTSHAQGTVYFQNYSTFTGQSFTAPITFASSGVSANMYGNPGGAVQAGWGVGSEFTADLLYSLDGGTTYTMLTFANSGASIENGPFGYPAGFTYGSMADGAIAGPNAASPGYFLGAGVTIPNYAGGSIMFKIEAFNGTSYANSVGAGLWRGESAAFSMSALGFGTTPTPYMSTMPSFTVSAVPEPTTLAFAGMGLLSLFALARRKKS